MPLVWDLTNQIKRWLTPDHLRSLNAGWHAQGGGRSAQVIDDMVRLLEMPNVHYESILGYLETQFRRARPTELSHDYHAAYSWLVEVVYNILYLAHIDNVDYISRTIGYLGGLAKLAGAQHPLWIFSVNHDLIVECIAGQHGVPLSAGFSSERVVLPRRDRNGLRCGDLHAEVLSEKQLESCALQFFDLGQTGINLLKIHGSLDAFAFRNGKDLLRLVSEQSGMSSPISALRVANEELIYPEPRAPGGRAKVTNEIAYADDAGEMQFLRRSLLAGAYKFDTRRDQVLPRQMLDCFRTNINWLTNLVCIGYGFGDVHINQVLREWLEHSAERTLELVAPGVQLPTFLNHLAPQVTLYDGPATSKLDALGGVSRSRAELVEKRFLDWARRRDGAETRAQWLSFIRQHQLDAVRRMAERHARLEMAGRAVELDEEALKAEIQRELPASREDLVEEFLLKMTPASPPAEPSLSEQVAQRAYFRWIDRGATHGGDLDDWLAAEGTLKR